MEPAIGGPGSRFKGKHSLDSDEEDDDEGDSEGRGSKYDILASDDVEGKFELVSKNWNVDFDISVQHSESRARANTGVLGYSIFQQKCE